MKIMENKETIIKDILDLNKWLYSLTGFGSADFRSKPQRIVYKTYRAFIQISFCTILLLMYREIVVYANNLTMLSFTLTFVLLGTVGVFKILIMHLRRRDVEEMKKRLDDNLNLPWLGQEDWEKEVRNRYSNILRMVIICIYFGVLAEGILTAALPLIKNGKKKFFLPFSFDYLVKTKYFIPIYSFHMFHMFIFLVNFVSNDMTFISLIARLGENLEIVEKSLNRFTTSYQFESLNWNLEDKRKTALFKDAKVSVQRELKKGNKLLKRCIMHHQAVLRELKIIVNIYSVPVVLHFIFGPFLCGFLSFVILSERDQDDIIIQQVVFAILAALYLLLFCYVGSYIFQKFQDVRYAFYSFPWYDMDLETKKLILIVLLGLGKSGKLTVGKIFDVTLTEYVTIAKTAYNFVTVLNNIT